MANQARLTRMSTRHGDEERGPDHVLGLVTDPDMPTQVGNRTAQEVVEWLEEETGAEWAIDVVSDPVTAGHSDSDEMLRAVSQHRERNGWRFAICLTDLPLLLHHGVLLADASTERGVALVSLPALGAFRPYRRTYRALLRLLADLLDSADGSRVSRPFRRSQHDGSVDVRYTTSRWRGWLMLTSGMVRANRPWQLMWGLSSALAAALAAAGFGIFTSTVWQIGDVLGPLRAIGTMVFSLGLMTGWLIAAHGLWERVGRRAIRDRRLALLYNASTVTTLSVGVVLLYLVVYAVSLVASATLLDASILGQTLGHETSWTTYLRLSWMVSSMAILAGALGSSLETDAAVRQAAYGYREEQRRAQYAEDEEHEQDTRSAEEREAEDASDSEE
ncbi:5,10-methylene-tetrahydrofolate dehydrogenase [Saccharopolyspora griseoalba]|uniref:5,10-methylene-tetrahydrofolate dehydrogenase n=1 Tax=Saccharopolyspora griseoalba TaxID=1431848 RepID=A0ABW2LV85_9PSEU